MWRPWFILYFFTKKCKAKTLLHTGSYCLGNWQNRKLQLLYKYFSFHCRCSNRSPQLGELCKARDWVCSLLALTGPITGPESGLEIRICMYNCARTSVLLQTSEGRYTSSQLDIEFIELEKYIKLCSYWNSNRSYTNKLLFIVMSRAQVIYIIVIIMVLKMNMSHTTRQTPSVFDWFYWKKITMDGWIGCCLTWTIVKVYVFPGTRLPFIMIYHDLYILKLLLFSCVMCYLFICIYFMTSCITRLLTST